MNSECIDLIYLDPPFNSNADYSAPIGSQAAGAAFKDTWSLSDVDVEWINLIEAKHPGLHRVLLAAMTDSDKSYLTYMAARLLEMKRVLKSTGSIWLHCDLTMSHYLKLVMDAIFGRKSFRNEIIWSYRRMPAKQRQFQRMHDCLLYYSNGDSWTFNVQHEQYSESSLRTYELARRRGYNANLKKKMVTVWDWDKYRSAVAREELPADLQPKGFKGTGPPMRACWTDIPIIAPAAKERTGYPTQKPEKLLQRIIKASSNEDDMVLDPFCGCATAMVAAETEGRQWAGIDLAPKAVELVDRRLAKQHQIFGQIIARTDPPLRTDLGKLPPPQTHKNILYGEQGGFCAGCGEHFRSAHLEVDHVIARANGGTDHKDNLQLLCGRCNRVKGDRGMEYLMQKLQLTQGVRQ